MVTLVDREAAYVLLSPAEKQELMLFRASRLRAEEAVLPDPRVFSAQEMARWIAEDEADMRRLREPAPRWQKAHPGRCSALQARMIGFW
jgi:hypothetical protein